MAPDRRLVDRHQVELAQRMCQASIVYVEQQLGLSTLRPPAGKALIRRLDRLRDGLRLLEEVLGGLVADTQSEDPTEPH